MTDSATAYAQSVLAGEVPACKWVRLACERHMRDLKSGLWRWDIAASEKAIGFLRLLRHYKGEYAGKPFDPLPWQCFGVGSLFGWRRLDNGLRRFRYSLILVPRKNGKALALDTRIPTPAGWTTMGEVKAGDVVFSDDGRPCAVTHATEVMHGHKCYRVTFSNGETVIADADHQWVTTARVDTIGGKTGGRRGISKMTRIRTTDEIARTVRYGARRDVNHSIAMPAPVQCEERQLPIDPYVLGAWLGDGTRGQTNISAGGEDVEAMCRNIEARGYEAVPTSGRTCWRIMVCSLSGGVRVSKSSPMNLRKQLRAIGVDFRKHIPAQYLRASVEQRVQLLRGLMDTDGFISKAGTQCEFSTKDRGLAEGMMELLASLGIKATCVSRYTKCQNGNGGDSFRILFACFSDVMPFALPRKIARVLAPRPGARSRSIQIVSVDEVDSVPVKCIAVDAPSRMYLFGRSMIPTHNTFLGAGVGLCLLCGDGEPAAEVYSVATKEDQARLLWNDGKQMIRFSPGAGDVFRRTVSEIRHEDSASFWKPLGSDSETLDGLNPHGVLADELHAWKDRRLWDIMDSALGARRHPLVFSISTEGDVRDGIFDEQIKLSQAVLENEALANGAGANVFALLFTADDGDDPLAEETWFKANPNLGCGKSLEYMRDQAAKAKMSPGKMRDFLTKQLNKRAEKAVSAWLSMEKWDACAGKGSQMNPADILRRIEGKSVFAGFDASRSQDLAAVSLLWFEADVACCAWLFFTPEETLRERELKDRAPYAEWVRAGWMIATPGNITDYRVIVETTTKLLKTAQAEAFWYDPSHGHEAAMQIRDDVGMVGSAKMQGGGEWHQVAALAQTFANFSRPYREIERRVIGGTLRHFGNPVARWNISNAVPHVGPSENIMLHKGRSRGRIDGAVALGMAFAAQLAMPVVEESAYAHRGIISL